MSAVAVKKINKSIPHAVEKMKCIFCKIVSGEEKTEIAYQDEEVCVFRDIKPASTFHFLVVPKEHLEDAKNLLPEHKPLVENMIKVAKDVLLQNGVTEESIRLGFHWPPFRSVKHLHLHAMAPVSQMGFIARMIFKPNSYWFVSTDYVLSRL